MSVFLDFIDMVTLHIISVYCIFREFFWVVTLIYPFRALKGRSGYFFSFFDEVQEGRVATLDLFRDTFCVISEFLLWYVGRRSCSASAEE